VNVLFTLLAIALVDKVGRKPLLLVGALGQAVMLGILALIFAYGAKDASGGLELTGKSGIIALVTANLYIAFFATTWGPVMWVMLGEMFPNRFRGAALAVAGLVQWGSNFHWFVRRLVTETKGRTLEEISMDES